MVISAMSIDADQGDELVLRARNDRDAFGRLYDQHYPGVLRYCIHRLFDRDTAEDVTATIFLIVARQVRDFTGLTQQDFTNWLYAIATRQINAYLSKTLRRQELLSDAVDRRQIRICIDADNEELKRLDWPRLYEAIASLSPDEQAIVTLRSFEKLPYEQVAAIVGIKAATARVIYSRALVKLRTYLGYSPEDV